MLHVLKIEVFIRERGHGGGLGPPLQFSGSACVNKFAATTTTASNVYNKTNRSTQYHQHLFLLVNIFLQ